jgi:ribosomal protein S18 acetylase RimI-like enzyme
MVVIAPIIEPDLPMLSSLYQELSGQAQELTRMRISFHKINDNPDYLVLGAKDGDLLIGSAMGVICTDLFGECRPFMVIENVIVRSDSRNKGIGKKLIRKLESEAEKRNCYYALLVSSESRQEAHQFYVSLGYKMHGYRGFKKHFSSQPRLP